MDIGILESQSVCIKFVNLPFVCITIIIIIHTKSFHFNFNSHILIDIPSLYSLFLLLMYNARTLKKQNFQLIGL